MKKKRRDIIDLPLFIPAPPPLMEDCIYVAPGIYQEMMKLAGHKEVSHFPGTLFPIYPMPTLAESEIVGVGVAAEFIRKFKANRDAPCGE